jgi:Rps23 Pro-64 3,4-dihydroxylase Tpa1-like proline 4-hydroxylase
VALELAYVPKQQHRALQMDQEQVKIQHLDLLDGRSIDVYDKLFTMAETSKINRFLHKSLFSTQGFDAVETTDKVYGQFFSAFSLEDLNNCGLPKTKGFDFLHQRHGFKDLDLATIRLNLQARADLTSVHTDTMDGITLVYFGNFTWETFYGGHLAFLNDTGTEIIYTCVNKPGRVVVFDGSIPHFARPVTYASPAHRFTLALQYNDKRPSSEEQEV